MEGCFDTAPTLTIRLRPEGLPETFEQLVEHYRLIELDLEKESSRKVVQTKQTYAVYLKARIVPRWGNYRRKSKQWP